MNFQMVLCKMLKFTPILQHTESRRHPTCLRYQGLKRWILISSFYTTNISNLRSKFETLTKGACDSNGLKMKPLASLIRTSARETAIYSHIHLFEKLYTVEGF